MHDLDATVVAVATPPGRGGVGCLRLSGPDAARVAAALFRPATRRAAVPAFGRFLDREGRPIDHGYLVLFEGRRAFTGEASAELWTHGSPVVLDELLRGAVAAGAVPAEPGEFTYRALRNGRLDLTRAEAVNDLVRARTRYQARVAFRQAEGEIARRLAPLRESLEEWIARTEAAVEFVDEAETHLAGGELASAIEEACARCAELLSGFERGRIVREGAALAVVGRPNAGKSSLFNRLLERERAIVTTHPGTTRDTLEEQLDLLGIPVRLVDTAGLRDVEDPVEGEGVRRALRAREEADLVLLVLDGTREPQATLEDVADERTVVVVNKCDLAEAAARPLPTPDALRVSALTGQGVDLLRTRLHATLVGVGPIEEPLMTNARQARALERAGTALDRAAQACADGLSEELILEDLRRALGELAEITGEVDADVLYERIFSTFCIGK